MDSSLESPYTILPFQFCRWDPKSFLLVNECGDYIFLEEAVFGNFQSNSLSKGSTSYKDLKSRHFLADGDPSLAIELIANKYRTRKGFLRHFTSLHMLVVTLRCNHDCEYCQVSAESDQAYSFDMPPHVANQIVDYVFQSPSPYIKIEFQGGEPSLNWPAVCAAVDHAETLNKKAQKNLEFVICTNLTNLNEEKFEYLRYHKVNVSTSLDGPRVLHDTNRKMRNGQSSHDLFLKKLGLARDILGSNSVSALMTTSSTNIGHFEEVVDEYIRLGFSGIFLRGLNPYGLAAKSKTKLSYSSETWLNSYKQGLDYIILKNLEGKYFVEFFTTLLLSRILTPFPTGFVDLQSPSGAAINGAIYDYNGDVYPADEARMLARMGDDYFRMGNVLTNSYAEIFYGEKIQNLIGQSNVEVLPGCADCVFQAYCGADPIRNYLESHDIVGYRPTNGFCKKNFGAFKILFEKLRVSNEDELRVFWSWITRKPLGEVRP